MRDRTIPPGDSLPVVEGPTARSQSREFTWQFDTHLAWEQYQDWVITQVRGDFRLVQRDPDHLVFSRQLPGDHHRLDIRRVDSGSASPPTHLRVEFVESPD